MWLWVELRSTVAGYERQGTKHSRTRDWAIGSSFYFGILELMELIYRPVLKSELTFTRHVSLIDKGDNGRETQRVASHVTTRDKARVKDKRCI